MHYISIKFQSLHNVLYILVIMTLMFGYQSVFAQHDEKISISFGKPTKAQNMEISNIDIFLYSPLYSYKRRLVIGFNARAGQLSVNDDSAKRIGIGAFFSHQYKRFNIAIPFGLMHLEKSHFGANEWHSKNYGGNVQFYYAAELSFNLLKGWQTGYRFEHMSNGDRYNSNPALDSHNITFSSSF